MEEKIIQEEPKRPKSSQKLQEDFKTLEQDWKSFTQSSLKIQNPLQKLRKTEDCDSVFRQILEYNSPKSLMSSLQNPTNADDLLPPFSSPRTVTVKGGKVWRVRENELAKEESRRRREQAIESGEIKGRRLFEVGFEYCDRSEDIESVLGSIYGDFEEKIEENDEIHSICSSISSDFDQGKTGEEEQGMLCFKEEIKSGPENGHGGRLLLVVKLLCFVVVFGMLLGLGRFGKEEYFVLTPT